MSNSFNTFNENQFQVNLPGVTSKHFDDAIKETSLFSLQESFDEIDERTVIYYFDILKSHRVQLQSQITDYWLENNTAVQDSINLSPLIINLTGLVGEVVYTPPQTFTGGIIDKLNKLFPSKSGFTLTQKLGTITSLIPTVDNYTQLAKNALNYSELAVSRYKKIYNQIQDWRKGTISNTIPRQQQIYKQFEKFWVNKTSLIVNTPYGTFENMYIQNVTMEQGETNTVSDIAITLKQLSFSDVEFTNVKKQVLEKYNQQAQAGTENTGKAKTRTQSFLKAMGGFVNTTVNGLFQ